MNSPRKNFIRLNDRSNGHRNSGYASRGSYRPSTLQEFEWKDQQLKQEFRRRKAEEEFADEEQANNVCWRLVEWWMAGDQRLHHVGTQECPDSRRVLRKTTSQERHLRNGCRSFVDGNGEIRKNHYDVFC